MAVASAPEGRVYSVTGLVRELKGAVEERWPLLWLEGEVSGLRPAASGHWYFTLKDEGAQVPAVMFRNANGKVRFPVADGDVVLCRGRLSVYEPRGTWQIVVDEMQPRGLGALQAAFEALKRRLQAEGLFDPARKRPLPFLPRRIGIVTSPTGAAIRDMLRILSERDPGLEVLVAPARVQGRGAADEIAAALDLLAADGRVQVILCGRGGGSIEDLWAFNEEVVARAIARCPVPVISCVGHEIDFTIADFVADHRAPTPTAAAETAVPRRADLEATLAGLEGRMAQAMARRIRRHRIDVGRLEGRLISPRRRLELWMQRLDELRDRLARAARTALGSARSRLDAARLRLRRGSPGARAALLRPRVSALDLALTRSVRARVELRRARLGVLDGTLHALSPLAVLSRGYAIVRRRGDGAVVREPGEAPPGTDLTVRLGTGALEASVTAVLPGGEGAQRSEGRRRQR